MRHSRPSGNGLAASVVFRTSEKTSHPRAGTCSRGWSAGASSGYCQTIKANSSGSRGFHPRNVQRNHPCMTPAWRGRQRGGCPNRVSNPRQVHACPDARWIKRKWNPGLAEPAFSQPRSSGTRTAKRGWRGWRASISSSPNVCRKRTSWEPKRVSQTPQCPCQRQGKVREAAGPGHA